MESQKTTLFDESVSSALFTDFYELTMAQAYDAEGLEAPAAFELFFRTLPENRNFAVAAGLEDVLDYLEGLRFSESEIEYLRGQGVFQESFLDRLRKLRFTGDVHAVREGTLVFPNEPILRITAPILQAQILETFVLNQIHLQTIAASKCARVSLAARDRVVVEFGSRRAHGTDAALKVARASYIAGHLGTSNVLAGKRYGIPLFGTMAHSYIECHADEMAAMEAFVQLYPKTTLLVDTYDTLEGVRKVVDLSHKLGRNFNVRAVRLDSGDLAALSKETRSMLDEAGLKDVTIFASGGLNEFAISELLEAGAPIDGFGVGTGMAVSEDAPSVDLAYKLVEYDGRPTLKASSGKATYPGRKQVFRLTDGARFRQDVVARHDEKTSDGLPLLVPVMRSGERLPDSRVSLEEIRSHAAAQLAQLPELWLALETASAPYPVRFSDDLEAETRSLMSSLGLGAGR